MKIEHYVGRSAEIVYLESKGSLAVKRVSIYAVRGGKVRVLDWKRKSFATLRADRILSAIPVIGRVS
ncbi:hypothetical protein [Cohnella nanjingensis]|uniref:WYL domain-containing protein n=1 Tax=Cohnella nanjingensis TaxID=1387779 RepID=A0A7X0VGG4_9BACL|nr:hypothetical protein [Cohnella nanjingensis]MBB6672308.1 hypothetical protein [Cohnella nanjingensis]